MAPLITKKRGRSSKLKRKTERKKNRHLKKKRGFRCSKDCGSKGIRTLRLPCPLCNKEIKIRHMSISACGHVFCNRCLHEAVRLGKLCPTCGVAIMKRKRKFQYRCTSGCDDEELIQQ